VTDARVRDIVGSVVLNPPMLSVLGPMAAFSERDTSMLVAVSCDVLVPLYEVFAARVPQYRPQRESVRAGIERCWSAVDEPSHPPPELDPALRSAVRSLDDYRSCGGQATTLLRATLRRWLTLLDRADSPSSDRREVAGNAFLGAFWMVREPLVAEITIDGPVGIPPSFYQHPTLVRAESLGLDLFGRVQEVGAHGGLDQLRRSAAAAGRELRDLEQAEWDRVLEIHPTLRRKCPPADREVEGPRKG
jgi:hypothetical protein